MNRVFGYLVRDHPSENRGEIHRFDWDDERNRTGMHLWPVCGGGPYPVAFLFPTLTGARRCPFCYPNAAQPTTSATDHVASSRQQPTNGRGADVPAAVGRTERDFLWYPLDGQRHAITAEDRDNPIGEFVTTLCGGRTRRQVPPPLSETDWPTCPGCWRVAKDINHRNPGLPLP